MHPRDSLIRILKKRKYELKFIKKVSVYPRDRLIRNLSYFLIFNMKKRKYELKFIKKVSVHPRDRLKRKKKEKMN